MRITRSAVPGLAGLLVAGAALSASAAPAARQPGVVMSTSDLMPLIIASMPVVALALAGMLVMLIGAFWPRSSLWLLPWVAVAGTVAAAYLTLWASVRASSPAGMQVLDGFTVVFDLIVLAATAAALLVSVPYTNREGLARGEYYSLMLLSASGAMLMAASDNLIMLFLGLELLSIPLYVLAGFARRQPNSEEAALKYFLLGAFASAFLVFGAGLVFATVGSTDISEIGLGLMMLPAGVDALLVAGLAMVTVGLAFKVALVPFHMWTPDVYQGAPTSVTAFMAVIAKAAGFAALVRIGAVGLQDQLENWATLLWVLSAATMVWGNLIAIAQQNVKRMLAYSSIAHAGYLLMGVLAGSLNGISAVLFYLASYGAMTLGAFAVVILLAGQGDTCENINDYRGAARRSPALGMLMVVFMLSLAGIPPFAGFFGKLYIFMAAIQQGYVGLTVLAVATSVIAVYYYLRVTVVMWMEDAPAEQPAGTADIRVPGVCRLTLAALAILTLGLGIASTPVLQWTDSGARAALHTAAQPGSPGADGSAFTVMPPER